MGEGAVIRLGDMSRRIGEIGRALVDWHMALVASIPEQSSQWYQYSKQDKFTCSLRFSAILQARGGVTFFGQK